MSMSVSFRAMAFTPPRVAFGARPRARSKHAAHLRRGDTQILNASRKRRKQKQASDDFVDRSLAETDTESATSSGAGSGSKQGRTSSSEAAANKAVDTKASQNPYTAPVVPLPTATRDDVMDSCYGTTFWLLAVGVLVREGAHFGQGRLPALISDYTIDLPLIAALHPPSSPLLILEHTGVAIAAAVVVTAGRKAALSLSPEFREEGTITSALTVFPYIAIYKTDTLFYPSQATNRSNRQVLRALDGVGDVVTVSVLPAVAEETLFRGVLLPVLLPLVGWPAAVIGSGAVFGALHVGGGRNVYFAAWASLVGSLYGAAAVYTGDVAVAMLAHALANYASASVWLEEDKRGDTSAGV